MYKSSSQIKKSFISKHSLGRKIYSDGPTLFHGCFTQITDTFGANQPVTSLAFIVLVRCDIYSDWYGNGKTPKQNIKGKI